MTLESIIQPGSADFARNAEVMRGLVAELREKLKVIAGGGGEASRARHTSRGKMLARQRVDLLVDPGTAFLELSPLAAHGLYGGDVHSASIVTGVGRISGRECVIVANDATIKGGTYYPMTVKKHLRAQDIARQNNLPCIYMVDSGGAFLPMQDEIFPDKRHFGRIFYNQAQMSAQGIPQIAIVMGSCTAGGAYVPAMSDESIIVRNQGTIFLGGPPLVKAATGEVVTAEELGGADVHSRQSGVTDHYAQNDAHAIGIARRIVATLKPPTRAELNMREPREPLFAREEIYGVVPADGRIPYDVRDIIARVVDGSEFDEFKKLYGQTLARISVMGGEQASMVLAQVRRDGIEAKGDTWSAEEDEKFRAPIRAQYESQGSPYYATARLWDDGVIDPVLGLGLSAAANAPIEPTKFGLFRM